MDEKLFPNELQPEPVDNDKLTKAQLLEKLEDLEQAHKDLSRRHDNVVASYEASMKELYDTADKQITDGVKLNRYYERKLKLISNLINLEQGGE